MDINTIQQQPYLVIGSVAIIAFAILATFFMFGGEKAPKGTKLPPIWTTGIPILGPIISFAKSPLGTIWKAREKCGDVFTIKLFGESCTFLIGSEPHTYFFSASDEELDQGPVYQFTIPIFGHNVLYDSPLVKRRQQLRALGGALKPSELRRYTEIIAKETEAFLREKWGDKGEIDLLPSMAELIIITASATLLGPEVRNELFHEVSHLYEMLDKGLQPLSVFFPHAPTSAHAKRDKARVEIAELFGRIVERRNNDPDSSSKNHDMLQKLIDFRYKDGTPFTHDELTGMLICALFAGQHTSSITTTWTLLLLLDGKNKGEKHFDEVLKELEQVEPSSGAFYNGEVTYNDIAKEDKLYGAIKEAIRMYPPLIMLMRRVMKPITMADGTHIPKGHRLMVSNAIAQMLPEVFENPESYNPDRWVDFDITKYPKYSFIGFGAGIHTCMGEPFAFMQIRTIISVILSTYDVKLMGDAPQPNYEAMVVPPKGPNMIRFQRKTAPTRGEKVGTTKASKNVVAPAVETDFLNADACSFSKEEVSKHNKKEDLWIIVKNKVYDVTNYVDLHQGGDAALVNWAGKDATDAVYGPQHPKTVPTLLEKYFIGNLAK